MRYVGQINYLLCTLVVTLILSDFVNLKYNFSFLKILDISEKERKKSIEKGENPRRQTTARGRGGRDQERPYQRHKRKEKEQRRCFFFALWEHDIFIHTNACQNIKDELGGPESAIFSFIPTHTLIELRKWKNFWS